MQEGWESWWETKKNITIDWNESIFFTCCNVLEVMVEVYERIQAH
jgi:hypothetical protein